MSQNAAPQAHTPTPWRIACEVFAPRAIRISGGKNVVCSVYVEPRDENAAFIVHACNNYDHLVSALREILDWSLEPQSYDASSAIERIARAALAAAESQS